jgi:uncharacterized membrane protein YhhN
VDSWWVLLIPTVAVGAVDWWAVLTARKQVERWAKPLTMAPLIAIAAVAGDVDPAARAFLVAGAVLGTVGDVALLEEGERRFLAGLGAFAAGHLAYVVGAVLIDVRPARAWPGLVTMAVLLGFRFVSRTLPGAREQGGTALFGAVVFYGLVISAMVLSAWATGAWLAGVGASLFAISDWVLGHRRFAGPLPGGRLAVMAPYHVGQALLIIGLATAG